MCLAYRQFRKYQQQRAMANPPAIHMPQPTYYPAPQADVYPPFRATPSPSTTHKSNLPTTTRLDAPPPGYNNNIPRPPPSRTPSPTPDEIDFLNGVRTQRSRDQRIRLYIVLALVIVVTALIESYSEKILNGLKPATSWMHRTPGAWLIPIVILIAMSFPPLFGHELVAMVCGITWGLGVGFAIVAAGTLLGEICTFFVFKYACSPRARKAEATNMSYATLAHVVRSGGLPIAIVIRFSALPAHLSTAVFATCGMQFWVFLVAAVVSLPKQLAVVYIGKALENNDSRSNKIQGAVLGVTTVITILAMVYIRRLRTAAKPNVVYARRKARQAALAVNTY
ncbi:hypothetical protein FB45DRAFT_359336 [Roridomyces roridus]|uniref:Golgi apparatus membrane protein TVP38 n=1 Tax=Roridomyces roridus TaxID=1738132 RepID=A0AAD7FT64_9AGAR|nr:hypothetical protein FB45DRAFT_359336 [Roridomyces roridus]